MGRVGVSSQAGLVPEKLSDLARPFETETRWGLERGSGVGFLNSV